MMNEIDAVVEETRELARIVVVDEIIKHPNADKLSLAIIGGWQCCVKLDEFKAGDLALYVEIDSLVPTDHPTFNFLNDRKESLKVFNEKVYSRIRTIRLRKELSQGILLQVPQECKGMVADTNVTKLLGVLKYEVNDVPTISSNINEETLLGKIARFISGPAKSNLLAWPSNLKKTEQIRLQNLGGRYPGMLEKNKLYNRSVKLDGQSVTMYSSLAGSGVCSRNNRLSTVDDHWDKVEQVRYWLGQLLVTNRRMFRKRQWVFPEWVQGSTVSTWFKEFRNKNQANRLFTIPSWKTGIYVNDDPVTKYAINSFNYYSLIEASAFDNVGYCIQGELCGDGIQRNAEGIPGVHFFVFSAYVLDMKTGEILSVMSPGDRVAFCDRIGVETVPILDSQARLLPTIGEMLTASEGTRFFTKDGQREGEVWEAIDGSHSFKVISNKYLLSKEKE